MGLHGLIGRDLHLLQNVLLLCSSVERVLDEPCLLHALQCLLLGDLFGKVLTHQSNVRSSLHFILFLGAFNLFLDFFDLTLAEYDLPALVVWTSAQTWASTLVVQLPVLLDPAQRRSLRLHQILLADVDRSRLIWVLHRRLEHRWQYRLFAK